ncbi:DUF2797 domain-containing protein [Phaeocystidibacter luteus]|uniref:DUF2797 domain-containing protein n=2 Tax=Phaeocystidibacter luteus TaxID=911197 RepID=A0A6N6RF69_9FLAO|nr:DUF2797 domain-containing protein [Phaeocystidibacter luteus]
MRYSGPLAKMKTNLQDEVKYYLEIGDDFIMMNDLIGKDLKMTYLNQITCFCGDLVSEVFRMNFCRKCFFEKPEAGDAILRPELSKAHLGEEDRDLEWEKKYQLQPHLVYLANSAGLKVGVTRIGQRPTRWIDQGAREAIVLAETENRFEAGQIEVALKAHMSDKTPWQRMVKGEDVEIDLLTEKKQAVQYVPDEYAKFISENDEVTHIEYPVTEYPTKAKSVNLEKNGSVEGKLVGIRGQYLLFSSGAVMNVRSHEGRHVLLEF